LRSRVRRGDALEIEEAAFLRQYEKDVGVSASEKITHTEERTIAAGTGSAAEAAASAAWAREEGRRLDFLIESSTRAQQAGLEALVRACTLFENMARTAMEHMAEQQEVHMGMLGAVREQYLAKTEAEIELMRAQATSELGGLDANGMLMGLVGQWMQQQKKAAPKNGAVRPDGVKPPPPK
jgi:hypothetical protein